MHNRFLTVATLSLLLTTSAPAWAQTGSTSPTPPQTQTSVQQDNHNKAFSLDSYKIGDAIDVSEIPALRNLLTDGETLRYMGDEYGVDAIFMTNGEFARIVYVTPDGQGILNGPLYGGDGGSVTLRQVSRLKNEGGFDPTPYLDRTKSAIEKSASQANAARNNNTPDVSRMTRPEPPVSNPDSPGEKLYREANAASWIAYGPSSAPMITTFMDPACDHCHHLFQRLKPLADEGKIYLRVLPVSAVDPTGKAKLINVFSSPSPAKAWAMLAEGLTPPLVGSMDSRASNAVTNNNNIFIRWKLPGTPYSVYRDKNNEVKVMFSAPEDINILLSDIGVSN